MRSLICGLCLAVMFAGGALAQTATVQPVQGDLSVNQGQGFQRVDSRIEANVGDTVMVGPGGSASLVYPDGCQVTIQPGSVVSVAPLSPCASGSLAQTGSGNGPDWTGLAWSLVTLGGIGAGVAGIIEAKSSTPTTPASK